MIKNFKNLDIWKRSMKFVKEIYEVSNSFPLDEKFGLTSQMRRAAVSVPSNIAEGCGRGTEKALGNFLDNAVGSNCEFETQVILSFGLGFITKEKLSELTDELAQIRRMILSYQKTLN